ncbi:MAG TPA: hypothetical protein VF071_11570 [Candidatus Limnocylindria bacterium]
MRDSDFTRLLGLLEAEVRDVEPETAFADELFVRLQEEVARSPRLSRQMVLLIAALLLVVLIGVTIAIGAFLLRTDPATELVRRSQAVHSSPPPFSVVTTSGPIEWEVPGWYTACSDPAAEEEWRSLRWRYEYDGAGSFQQACIYGGPPPGYVGGLEVVTQEGHGVWNAAFWELLPGGFLNRPPGAPLATLLWLNWLDPQGATISCEEWQLGDAAEIAGRDAQAVSCGNERFWIDRDSGMLLRRDRGDEVVAEVLELKVGVPPDDAITLYPAGFSTQLVIGQAPAQVQLNELDGSTWSSSALAGLKTAVLVQWACPEPEPCITLGEFSSAVAAHHGELGGVAISLDQATTFSASDIEAARAAGIPVLVDDSSGWPRWEYPILSGLMLFDADGRLAELLEARTVASMAAALEAFVAGTPLPELPPWDGYFTVGQPAPALTGERLGGGVFDSSAAPGIPVAILVTPRYVPGAVDAACPSAVAAQEAVATLASVAPELAGSAIIGVIAWGNGFSGEPFDGWDGLLDELGVSTDNLAVVAPDEQAFSSWYPFVMREDCSSETRSTLAVVDRAGLVHSIGPPPDAADMVDLLSGL